jgi:hypothetical protein
LLDELVRRVRHGGWRSPWRWAAIALAIAAAIFVAGENPGNFFYGCLVVATAVGLSLQWRSRSRLREASGRLAPATRALVEWLVVPLWLWSLSPRPIHPRSLFAFLRTRPGDLPPLSLESLAYYPRSLFGHYLDLGAAAWLVAALALAGFGWVVRRGESARAVALTAALGGLALAAHPMREDRFLATAFPMLALLATLVAARGAGRLLPGAVRARLALGATLTLAAAAGAGAAAARSAALERLESDHRLLTAEPEYLAPLAAAAFWASEPGVDRVAMLGGSNELSEAAVRWEAWRGHGADRFWVAPLRGLDGATPADEVARRLDRWLARECPDRLVVLRPLPRSRWLADADYRRYNAWQIVAAERLAESPDWRAAARPRVFPQLGLELLVLDRAASPGG